MDNDKNKIIILMYNRQKRLDHVHLFLVSHINIRDVKYSPALVHICRIQYLVPSVPEDSEQNNVNINAKQGEVEEEK
jgi:hypothetical protein